MLPLNGNTEVSVFVADENRGAKKSNGAEQTKFDPLVWPLVFPYTTRELKFRNVNRWSKQEVACSTQYFFEEKKVISII